MLAEFRYGFLILVTKLQIAREHRPSNSPKMLRPFNSTSSLLFSATQELIMSLVNVWHLRKVAEASSKPCDICYKPTTNVMITPDNKVCLIPFSLLVN